MSVAAAIVEALAEVDDDATVTVWNDDRDILGIADKGHVKVVAPANGLGTAVLVLEEEDGDLIMVPEGHVYRVTVST
jgi:hypothetical protein